MSRSLRVAPEYIAKVKLAIKRSGFPSQQALATESVLGRSTVSNFVNGKPVDFGIFVEICDKLGLDWQAIVDTKQADKEVSMSESKLKQKYPNLPVAVILTAIPEETTAVLHHLGGVDQTQDENHYFCNTFGSNGQNWLVAVKEIGQYNINSLPETLEALNCWQPKVILFVGIAGSLRGVGLGDVVAANLVSCYEQGKFYNGKFLNRQQVVFAGSNDLIQLARNQIQRKSWQNRIECGCPDEKPKLHVEAIVSGEKLMADIDNEFYGYLVDSFSGCEAVEMEGYGFHCGVADYRERTHQRVEALVIRSISDLIHNQTDERNPDRKVIAARHASAFAFEILAKFKVNDEGGGGNGDRQHSRIKENLRIQSRPNLIGRQEELSKLMRYLSTPDKYKNITVSGIGGVGKTALVLEAAYRCLEASEGGETLTDALKFEVIIYTSAKERILTPSGIQGRKGAINRTLRQIVYEIASTLKDSSINQALLDEELSQRVILSLSKQSTLLIIDNLETLENKEQVEAFLYELPPSVKVMLTSREKEAFTPIQLNRLPEPDCLKLIEQLADEKGIVDEKGIPLLSENDSKKLSEAAHGLPLAIAYAIGRLAKDDNQEEDTLEEVIKKLRSSTGDLAQCLFEKAVEELKERYQVAYKLLISLAIFPEAPRRDAVREVAGLKCELDENVNDGFRRLSRPSFAYKREDNRYEMLSLTRAYALAQFKVDRDFSIKARERWVTWYIDFANNNGGEDWKNWHIRYNYLKAEWENLLEVLSWCADPDRYGSPDGYNTVKELWKKLNRFANIYGYWLDRVEWLSWLIDESTTRKDLATTLYAMAKKGWTLTLRGRPQDLEDANEIFTKAWGLREQAKAKLDDEIYLANHIAALRIRQEQLKPAEQQRYEKATEWLDQANDLYQKFCTENPDEKPQDLTRRRIRIPYYKAQIYYYQGNYDDAKKLLKQVISDAEDSEWQRVVVDAWNWLADVLIKQVELVNNLEEANNLLKEAEDLLNPALEVAKSNQNKRRVALCQRSYAGLESARPEQERNSEEIRRWAEQARKSFDEGELEMTREANEMRDLIASLE